MARFANKIVVVTGAGGGIGREFAMAFAREGATVAATDIALEGIEETRRLIVDAGGQALAVPMNVAQDDSVTTAIDQIITTLGDIDILINNAGIAYGNIYHLTTMPLDLLRQVMDVNVLGPLMVSKACHPSMQRRGGGVIVNISSMASYSASGAYGMSKAAVNNLTEALADEWSSDNIRVNAIAPGLMNSPASQANVNQEFQKLIQSAQSVRRPGNMADISAVGLFLCSNDASFINGQVILVDGGFMRHTSSAVPVPLNRLANE